MITAAIYSRKSTEQDVTEEAKSVTRQIEHARAYATRKGWTVADEHIYVDDGISGAEFKKRPGLLRLLNAFDPTPPFQVLIMLAALVQGTTDPAVLAELARGRLRGKLPALRQALANRFRPHHAFVLGQLLTHLDYLDEAIATLSAEIERVMAPWAEPLRRLDTIPGINQRTAEVILAEIGPDMRVFPSARHLASWAALCPGHHESAGKHKSGKTRKGNRWLRTALIEAAAGASRAKHSALQARFHRVLRHRGPKKAVVAVAHALLSMVYHVLADGTVYREAGADYCDRHHTQRVTRRAVQALERQGYRVILEPAA